MAHVETAGDVGRGNDHAVGVTGGVGVGFEYLMVFPVLLPFGFGLLGVVLGGKIDGHCGLLG